jgi:mRNA-degrading endonuclease RelE of RelBE toxin-antitoxin system
MYEIHFAVDVEKDLKALKARDQRIILDAIEEQLTHQPEGVTKNRKILFKLIPPWQFVPPVRELRVGEYRVFYDVDSAARIVYVRAIRRKPPHMKTEDVL